MKNVYNKNFYNMQKDVSLKSAEIIIPIILKRLNMINSVIDFGCGFGTWLSVFKENGVTNITGIDGEYVNKNNLYIDISEFIGYDLTKPIELNKKFDLAISLEVAEHLPEAKAKTFVNSICKHSDIVMFGAAYPGQGGTNHINEQPISYWKTLFAKNNYICIDCIREDIWQNNEIDSCYSQNTVFYVNNNIKNKDIIIRLKSFEKPLNAVHPGLIRDKNIRFTHLKQLLQIQMSIIKNIIPLIIKSIKLRYKRR